MSGCTGSKPSDPSTGKSAASPVKKAAVQPCTPAQDPVLTNVSGPKDMGCGGYAWKIWFDLPKPAAADGWVIQEITVVYDIKDNTGKTINNESVHYWEAWQVKKGKSGTVWQDEKLDDNDDAYTESSRKNTKGSSIVTGKAKFYEGDLPGDFKTNNPDTQAGILHATTKKPSFWDGTGTDHNITATWDCTGADSPSTISAQAGATKVPTTK